MMELITWLLDKLSASMQEKPKLNFQMVSTPDDELTEKGLRTKTSPSDYGVEIFNIGEKTLIVESLNISYKGKTISDYFLDGDERIIEPNHNVVYTLMEQDASALEWHCKQSYFEECDITAYCIDGKKIKGKLEVPLIAIRAKFANSLQ